jgi:hypothetical protein
VLLRLELGRRITRFWRILPPMIHFFEFAAANSTFFRSLDIVECEISFRQPKRILVISYHSMTAVRSDRRCFAYSTALSASCTRSSGVSIRL